MLKIIGAGFGRTGTLSLKLALDHLGLGPTFHAIELLHNPELVNRWQWALETDAPTDWQAVFKGYQSALDWPTCNYAGQLLEAFPDAKVIFTDRDRDGWFESISQTIFPLLSTPLDQRAPEHRPRARLMQKIVIDDAFDGRIDDRAYVLKVYEKHRKNIKKITPPEQLLIWQVSEGWAPLCRFLGVPTPAIEFPNKNSRASYLQNFNTAKNDGA